LIGLNTNNDKDDGYDDDDETKSEVTIKLTLEIEIDVVDTSLTFEMISLEMIMMMSGGVTLKIYCGD
jgi:hypothetical protein